MRKIKEAIALFDNGDSRSFNQIYSGKEDLFEDDDIDSIISPRMKKLFEEVYGNTQQRLKEEVDAKDNPHHNFTGGEGSPKPDGVPSGHNPSLSKGPTNQVTQSGARQDDNSSLGNEPPKGDSTKYNESLMKEIFEKAQLNESFDFDDDEFSHDAAEDDFLDDEDDGELELEDNLSFDDLEDDESDDFFPEDDFDGTSTGMSDDLDFSEDDNFDEYQATDNFDSNIDDEFDLN